ncbi:major facilitator superfamily domain-containing protein [Mrakia frigida]|uniref:MFS transporter n=1 Tax=Mrakia frigida TaxID=29902 RepID=UPI003FCC1EBD
MASPSPSRRQRRLPTPLPKFQLFVVLAARIVEPIGYSAIFPFVNNMMEDLLPNVEKSRIGAYGGFIESVFAISQVLVMYRWGRLSDRVGRKPIILIGLSGSAFSLLLFGLSRNYWWAFCARTLGGLSSGNASVIRAVLGEITDKTNEGRVFPLWSICWDLSLMIGPIMGGMLVSPAIQYPHCILARIPFLKTFPYFLPCFAASCLSFISFLLVWFFLDETLESKRPVVPSTLSTGGTTTPAGSVISHETDPLLANSLGLLIEPQEDAAVVKEGPVSALQLFSIPKVQKVLVSYFMIVLISLSYDAVFILWCYSALKFGGLALTPKLISYCLAARGLFSIVFSLLIFPLLLQTFGMPPLYRLTVFLWVPVYILPPVMNLLSSHSKISTLLPAFLLPPSPETATHHPAIVWALMALLLVIYALGDLCFPLNMMALNVASPSKGSLGSLNGLALTIGSAARSIVDSRPLRLGSLYSLSAEKSLPIVWIVYGIGSAASAVQCWSVEGRSKEEEEADKVEEEVER